MLQPDDHAKRLLTEALIVAAEAVERTRLEAEAEQVAQLQALTGQGPQ